MPRPDSLHDDSAAILSPPTRQPHSGVAPLGAGLSMSYHFMDPDHRASHGVVGMHETPMAKRPLPHSQHTRTLPHAVRISSAPTP